MHVVVHHKSLVHQGSNRPVVLALLSVTSTRGAGGAALAVLGAMPKKKGKGKKGKKGEQDWGLIQREKFVMLEVMWRPLPAAVNEHLIAVARTGTERGMAKHAI